MTRSVLVIAPDGSTVEARALLDCASSASFVSERILQSLSLPRSNQMHAFLMSLVSHVISPHAHVLAGGYVIVAGVHIYVYIYVVDEKNI